MTPMTDKPEPTAEHTRALRRALSDPGAMTTRGDDYREHLIDWQIRALLAEPAALAANLPTDAMLTALVERGALTEEQGGAGVTDPNPGMFLWSRLVGPRRRKP